MKKPLRLTLALVATALIASCGGNASSEASDDTFKPALDPNTSCELTVVGSLDDFQALDKEIEKFCDEATGIYRNVRINYYKPDDYENDIITLLEREDDAPNIFVPNAAWMSDNEKYNSVLAHMEDLSDPKLKLNLGCIRPGLRNRDASGKVSAVPVFSRTYGMLVNKDLFKRENIAIPTTWNELLAASSSLLEKGYESPMMGYSLKDSACLMNIVAYPAFVAALAKNPEMVEKANNLDPSAGEYMRGALTQVKELIDGDVIDLNTCDTIADNYNEVLLRFLEGDVPMMLCGGDTPSGIIKRQDRSQAYSESPFEYALYPVPMTEQGGYFIDSPSIKLSVNKDCKNLDMTNEFMRFLISDKELSAMASIKHLVTPTKDMSFDSLYAPFGQVPEARTYSPEALGVEDPLAKQIRIASYKVGRGLISVEDAVSNYGQFK